MSESVELELVSVDVRIALTQVFQGMDSGTEP